MEGMGIFIWYSESFPMLKLSQYFDSNYIVSKAKRDWIFASMICGGFENTQQFSGNKFLLRFQSGKLFCFHFKYARVYVVGIL